MGRTNVVASFRSPVSPLNQSVLLSHTQHTCHCCLGPPGGQSSPRQDEAVQTGSRSISREERFALLLSYTVLRLWEWRGMTICGWVGNINAADESFMHLLFCK